MFTLNQYPAFPTEHDSTLAGAGLELLNAQGKNTLRLSLEGQDKSMILPASVIALLQRIFAEMAQGKAVDIASLDNELTTQQTADLLNVSRPFVIKLLDTGELSHRLVGRNRRVLLRDVLAHKETMQRKSKAALEELTELSQELNTY